MTALRLALALSCVLGLGAFDCFDTAFKKPASGEGQFGYACAVRKHGNVDGTWSEYFKTQAERNAAKAKHTSDWGVLHVTQDLD